MKEVILSVDIGTTSLKAGFITAKGEVVSVLTVPFKETQADKIADEWIKAFYEAKGNLSHQNPDNQIVAIAVSGNGPTVVSENGVTLKWNTGEADVSGIPSIFIPRLLLFRKNFPQEFEKTKFIFSGPEYFIWKLTGKAATILPEERYLKAYWTIEDLEKYNFPVEKLPEFVELGFNFGTTEENIPVFGIGPDFIAGLIGTETTEAGRLCDRCGSSEGFNFCVDREIYADGVRTLPSVKKGLWNVSILIPESSRFSEEVRLQKVKQAVEKLRRLATANGIPFPQKMTVTGGQAKNTLYLQKKAQILGMELVNKNCPDAELLGDAKIGWEKYENL